MRASGDSTPSARGVRTDHVRVIDVAPSDAGQRLDVLVARELEVTRGYVRRLLARGRILLRGRPARKGDTLRAGDRVELLEFRHPSLGPLPNDALPLRVLGEGQGLLAVDKPAGLPTHPLDYDERDTLLNALLARYPAVAGVGEGGLRSGVVHRLDVRTSGAILFATDGAAWARARRAFAERRVEKRYVARVHGRLERAQTLRLRLDNRGDHTRVVRTGGREAVTHVATRSSDGDTSLLDVRPETGLRHQIRASLAWLGHPVVGDALYGSTAPLARHLLHARLIRIDGFSAASPIPDDFV